MEFKTNAVGGFFMSDKVVRTIITAELLKEDEVARMIGMSVHWLRRMRWCGGGIPFIKLTMKGAVRYRKKDVEAFVAERVRKSTSDSGKSA
jgi:predicted DNA-binding transcriptional regulator AlpA